MPLMADDGMQRIAETRPVRKILIRPSNGMTRNRTMDRIAGAKPAKDAAPQRDVE